MDILINIGCLFVGCFIGVFLVCAIVVSDDDRREHHMTSSLQKHELKENEWYWNDEHKKYYQIANSTDVNYAFNGNTIKNCVYVNENEYIKPIFYVNGVWFKYRESVVK